METQTPTNPEMKTIHPDAIQVMTPNQYQLAALSTESPVKEDRFVRYMQMRDRLTNVLNDLRQPLLIIDAIKKFIFYGKENKVLGIQKAITEVVGEEGLHLGVDPIDVKFIRFLHAILGILSECEEFIDPVLAGMQHPSAIDVLNGQEEFGDVQWYIAIGDDALGVPLEKMMRANLAKLAKRYPEKFTEAQAINRDTAAEAGVMKDEMKSNLELAR